MIAFVITFFPVTTSNDMDGWMDGLSYLLLKRMMRNPTCGLEHNSTYKFHQISTFE